jgi:hypothetical protein
MFEFNIFFQKFHSGYLIHGICPICDIYYIHGIYLIHGIFYTLYLGINDDCALYTSEYLSMASIIAPD